MTELRKSFQTGVGFEWIFALLVIASVLWAAAHLFIYDFLPSPFFYEPGDTYADWFNTAFWARNQGTYDVWTALYPPLSFVLLQVLGLNRCYPRTRAIESSPGLAARDCDWLGISSIWGLWLISVVLIYLLFRKVDRRTAIPRTICVGLGWPLLDAVERGNLLLMALPCYLLAATPLLKSAKLRWFFAGIAINLKVYLIASFMSQLFKRRWRWVEGVLLSTVVVYLISYALLGRGTPMEIFHDLLSWSENKVTNPLDIWPATTYQPLYSLLNSDDPQFPTLLLLGSRNVGIIQLAINVLLRTTQGFLLGAMLATWLRPEVTSPNRLFTLGLMLALVTSEAGGYTPAFFMVLVLIERWRGFGRIYAICACYLMALSFDVSLTPLTEVTRETYFRHATVQVEFDLTLWPFLRPALIQTIAIALSCNSLRAVWRDLRLQGWAGRWRFRSDAPILPNVRRPSPPEARQS